MSPEKTECRSIVKAFIEKVTIVINTFVKLSPGYGILCFNVL